MLHGDVRRSDFILKCWCCMYNCSEVENQSDISSVKDNSRVSLLAPENKNNKTLFPHASLSSDHIYKKHKCWSSWDVGANAGFKVPECNSAIRYNYARDSARLVSNLRHDTLDASDGGISVETTMNCKKPVYLGRGERAGQIKSLKFCHISLFKSPAGKTSSWVTSETKERNQLKYFITK